MSQVVVKAELPVGVHQSRWGFHPCDREFFLKLKMLHKLYWKSVYVNAAWKRWNAKLPQNRVHRRYGPGGRRAGGQPVVTPWSEPKRFSVSETVVRDYQKARNPAPSPGSVLKLSLSETMVDELLSKLADFK